MLFHPGAACREALGELSGANAGAGAGAARNIQLLLLRYQFLDTWACTPGQQQYLMYLLGKAPAPQGFEKQRRGTGGPGGEAGDGRDGSTARDREDRGAGWSPGHQGDRDGRGGASVLPPLLGRFLESLPKEQFLDGPLPDLNLVVDTLYGMDEDDNTGGYTGVGVKRELDGDEHDMGGPGRDIFRMRAKQRARMTGDA